MILAILAAAGVLCLARPLANSGGGGIVFALFLAAAGAAIVWNLTRPRST